MYICVACVCLLPTEAEGLGSSGTGLTEDFETWDLKLGVGSLYNCHNFFTERYFIVFKGEVFFSFNEGRKPRTRAV